MGRPAPVHVDDPVAVGRRLRELREKAGLSQRQLAFEGCSPAYLSRVEAGTRVPSPRLLETLARRLGVTPEELAGRPLDLRIPERELVDVEMAARMGDEDARGRLEDLVARARELGDGKAASRALEALGQIALDERDDGRAVALFDEARDLDDAADARSRPTLFLSLGRAHAASGDMARSLAVLRHAFEDVASAPVDPVLLVRFGTFLAYSYTDAGRPGDAELVLAQVLRHEAELTDPLSRARLSWGLARTYAENGRLAVAERYARWVVAYFQMTEERATLGQAHLLLGAILLDARREDDARPELQRARELFGDTAAGPDLAVLSVEEARAALMRDDLDEAVEAARRALDETADTEPASAGQAYLVLAEAAYRREDLAEARYLCHRAIEVLGGKVAPHYLSDAYRLLASVEETAGDLPAALAAMRESLELQATRGG
jgi:transcriptional regulator with XRE-family HTH domain